ncbi:MAG: PD40 domain-containing protein [Chloroflexi bacterium]|nr:PD40 domain-containing protein [Chloroflexota bacterium]
MKLRSLFVFAAIIELACNAPLGLAVTATTGGVSPSAAPPQGTKLSPATSMPPTETPPPTLEPEITIALADSADPVSAIYYARPDGTIVRTLPLADSEIGSDLIIGGERVFFGDFRKLTIGEIDQAGRVNYLAFTYQPHGFTDSFLPSPDGQYIAWATLDITSFDEPIQATAQLHVAGENGTNPVVVSEEQNQGQRIIVPVRWRAGDRVLFAAHQPYGIGGYILFGVYLDLFRLDLDSGVSTTIIGDCSSCDVGLSPDGTKAAFVSGGTADLTLFDVSSGKRRVVPGAQGHAAAGNIVFSPDGSRLVYTEAVVNPEAERFAVYLVDFASGVKTTLIPDDARELTARAWPLAGVIILSGYEAGAAGSVYNTWTMRADGSGLTQTFPGKRFLGVQ